MSQRRTPSQIRERIVTTATRLFHAQGYHATGINQIIAEAEVAKASFYAHFPSKETLGQAFLARRHEKWFDMVAPALAAAPTARAKILALFDLWTVQLNEDGFRGCAFVNMAGEFPDQGAPVRALVKSHKQAMRALINRLAAEHSGRRPEEPPVRAVADAIYLLFDSVIVECRNFNDTWPLTTARHAADRLLSSLDDGR